MIIPVFVLLCMATSTLAASLSASDPIAIVAQSSDISPDGSFSNRWESANGISFQEEGVLKNAGTKDEAESVQGSASWTAPDGTKLSLDWNADENGAVFQGAHLPTPPPVPEIPAAIQRALDWIAAHPQKPDARVA
ncbi:endocuticle structural glycoprotein SgAbd-2-like isoform X2 [Venturia canescens]|nr:endocuticle structural glycoprotein SgAbd-2-like isoform X2 [Venturia canescens]